MVTKTKIDLSSYALAFDIPHYISLPIVELVRKWICSSGEEWTVRRLKDLKTDFLKWKAGEDPTALWISRRKSMPRGPFRGLYIHYTKTKDLFSCVQLFNIYTSFTSSKVTEIQEKKFLDGVQADSTHIPQSLIKHVIGCVPTLNVSLKLPDPIYSVIPSGVKRSPLPDGTSVPEEEGIPLSMSYLTHTRLGRNLRNKYPKIFQAVAKDTIFFTQGDSAWEDFPDSIGKIGLIQEPGYKLRAVANPGRVYQIALKPLGDFLYRYLKTFPWDCTHDQSRGFPVIQECLQRKQMVYSVDLTGATDYFPLELQLEILRKLLGPSPYIDLFEDLSRSPWRYQDTFISWSKGQPLGLHPSFASFAMSHGVLLYALNGDKHENAFFVLGDDVVILDSQLHDRYLETLESLDCPISESKSFSSRILSEFGGKIVTSDGVTPQMKWRNLSDDNFISILQNIGVKGYRLLRPRQRRIAKKLEYLPSFLGGLGWNPKGIPLIQRVEEFYTLFSDEKSMAYLMSYSRLLQSYSHKTFSPKVSHKSHLEISGDTDLDQRSVALIQRYLPILRNWYQISGYNLYSLLPDLGMLSIEGGRPSRSTLLSHLESKI